MTVNELHDKYGFSIESQFVNGELVLNPIYNKHLPACWLIQDVWGHVEAGNISLGKARELTAAIIEELIKEMGL